MEKPYLIVGLGNPGAEYARTRHNAGFLLVERLAQQGEAEWAMAGRLNARLAKRQADGRRVIFCEPQTFMNRSGEAVRAVMDYYGVTLPQLLVAVDDADLPLGELRLRGSGGPGGHHGLESIEQHLGTRGFARQRIGIGRQPGAREITGHVLGRISAAEWQVLETVLDRACDQAACWLQDGISKAMSQFNGAITGSVNEEANQ